MTPRKANREAEGRRKKETPRTTVVGARPPRDESLPRRIPRGLEVLVKKAAVDPGFKKILLEQRAGAAEAIGLNLTAAEEAMLASVPLPHLEGIIAHTEVTRGQRKVFLGYAAATMLAALGGTLLVCERTGRECRTEENEITPLGNNSFKTLKTVGSADEKGGFSARMLFPGSRYGATDGDLDAIVSSTAGIRSDRPLKENGLGRGVNSRVSLGIRPGLPIQGKRPRGIVSVTPRGISAGAQPSEVNRTPRAIDAVVRRHLFGLENAYNSALKENPNLSTGRVTVKFTVAPAGDVNSAHIVNDTLGAPGLCTDIIDRIKTWRFPPARGSEVTVTYPFVFIAEEG